MLKRKNSLSVVTSCSLKGWNEYGKQCLPRLLEHWPSEVNFHLVSEDLLPLGDLPLLARDRLTVWPLNSSLYDRVFHNRYMFDSVARGKRTRYYDYRFDAWKFSKKVFAIELVAHNVEIGRLFWVDADVLTLKPVPVDLLHRVCPDDCHISYLARPKMHSECGFVGYNLNKPETKEFIKTFANCYSSGRVFKLKEWHDSYVFDVLRKEIPELQGYCIPNNNPFHPFNFSELGHYMDHMKGKRKQSGKSHDHPLYKRM